MQPIKEIVTSNYRDIVNNDNKKKSNNAINDNNDTHKSKYALDRNKFVPNTEESMLAEEIAMSFDDLNNFASFFNVVKRLGCLRARTLFQETLGEIAEKRNTKYPVRNAARYFMWKVRYGH